MKEGFVEFEFDPAEAVLALSAPAAGQIVYIGKADAEAGLRKRPRRHAWTIQHRQNLSVQDITLKAVRVFVFAAIDLERQLIRHDGTTAADQVNSLPHRRQEATV
ncbi:MAG: GIY-YIG nuclease family protein [Mesorhizobium sp.]|nr:MAG: GIY-YIG nuclease family protein [Mesorhizobium sp.]